MTTSSQVIRLNLGISKVYLLKQKSGYLMIDTGYFYDYSKFQEGLRENHINGQEIQYLFLTHHHDDHAGFAQKMKADYGVKLILHEKAIEFLRKGESDTSGTIKPLNRRTAMIMNTFMLFHKKFKFPSVKIDKSDIVVRGNNSTIMREIGINGDILYTPGHTPDSISLCMDNGDVFCGDVAMNFMKIAGTQFRPIYVNDINDVYKSWKKILEKGAKTIYPTHGNSFPARKLNDKLQKYG